MKKLIFSIFLVTSVCVFAQSKPGKFAHLSLHSGTWNVESVFMDDSIVELMSKDFRINLEKFRLVKEDSLSQIDVIKGNMLISSSFKEDPCLSSTFMSISLTDDDTVYLLALRDKKIRVFHTVYGKTTRDMKGHKFSKEVSRHLKKMINQCKVKGLQNT